MTQPIEYSADRKWQWDGKEWRINWLAWKPHEVMLRTDIPLQQRVNVCIAHGYRVTNQTDTSAQLVKPKVFSFLWATAWFLLCGVGVLVYIFYFASKQDETIYLQAQSEQTTRGEEST